MSKNSEFIFRANLREVFQKFDTDGNDLLSRSEMKELILMTIHKTLSKTSNAKIPTKLEMNMMVDGIVDEILGGMDRDVEAELPWSEFLEFMDKATY